MNRGFAVDRRRQVLLADDDARDGESVGRVALAEATQATALASREPGGHFDDLLAGGLQSVRHGCAQAAGALDADPPWRGQTGQEALEAAEALRGVADAQLAELATEVIHSADGEALLVSVDTDSDHVPLLDEVVYDEGAAAGQPCVELRWRAPDLFLCS